MHRLLLLSASIALIAVLVGSVGADAARLITGRSIKNGSITGVDIKNGSIAAADLRPSARARDGEPGRDGLQGLPGPAGGFDPSKVTIRAGATDAIAGGDIGTLVADCLPGEVALSGGYAVIGDDGAGFTYISGPNPGDRRQWVVSVDNTQGIGLATGQAVAVCAGR